MADSLENSAKESQSHILMSSLNRFRKNEFLCDFTVVVGTKSLPVHRTILAASSEYFEALFSSNMKEVAEGFIDMKDVESNAIEICIGFMYTGEAKITMKNIEHILHASNMLQLYCLRNICFQVLRENLSSQNCLFVINLARIYDRFEMIKLAEQVLVKDFSTVASSLMFPSVFQSDLMRYMETSNEGYEKLWQAAVAWLNGQDEATETNFSILSATLNLEKFPYKFFEETVLEEPIVKENEVARNIVIAELFRDPKKLGNMLEVDNCFKAKLMSETHVLSDSTAVIEVINQFLKLNFEEIIELKEYFDLRKEEVIELLSSSSTKYSSEVVKWEAMLSWINNDLCNRKSMFTEFFCLIKLSAVPVKFLKEIVRSETLVVESPKCNGMLIDELFCRLDMVSDSIPAAQRMLNRASIIDGASGVTPTFIKKSQYFIPMQPEDGKMTVEYIKTQISPIGSRQTIIITYAFPAGKLEGISYNISENFKAYLPGTQQGWQLLRLLEKAFAARSTFKLEIIGNGQGKVVWSDIPHNPNPYGYNPGYLLKLANALKAKGFTT